MCHVVWSISQMDLARIQSPDAIIQHFQIARALCGRVLTSTTSTLQQTLQKISIEIFHGHDLSGSELIRIIGRGLGLGLESPIEEELVHGEHSELG